MIGPWSTSSSTKWMVTPVSTRSILAASSGHLFFRAYEPAFDPDGGRGVDYNGDGDTIDNVLHAYELATDTIHNVGLATETDLLRPQDAAGGRVVSVVSEAAQGAVDLNADGDTSDQVVHLYDAVTHTFSTLSTGGFSPRNGSIAAFDSPWVHVIVIVFMILAGANFSLFFGMRLRRGWNLLRDTEFRLYVQILGAATLIAAIDLFSNGDYSNPLRALLDSAFQVVSIMTTTGFVTADFDAWQASQATAQ